MNGYNYQHIIDTNECLPVGERHMSIADLPWWVWAIAVYATLLTCLEVYRAIRWWVLRRAGRKYDGWDFYCMAGIPTLDKFKFQFCR